ncbi:MAG: cobalt-precorrin-6A reductase [Octadecabacter sp.]|nr:cobalt-precorrin-6A reductase [Octadecabacter sp.]
MSVLLLAGTAEAKRIAWGLADSGLNVVASLAGATRDPEPLPVPTRIGGFGGEAEFRAYLMENGVTAVVDATHPFASRITARTARVCAELRMPYLQVLRPVWQPEEGDRWIMIDRPEEAVAHIPKGDCVFLATGRQTIPQFANLEGRRILVRVIDPPTEPFPFEGGEFIIGRPPFPVAREKALFEALGVEWLVVKNAGGQGGRAKLDAARALGLPVVMINRAAVPDAPFVDTAEAAVAWVKSL